MTTATHTPQIEAIEVACPACKALAGNPCTCATGFVHVARTKAANDLYTARRLGTDDDYEGPTCSICDGLGHGYPGGAPCPLESADYSDEPWWAV